MHNGETLKLGLIGCGMMGAHYADAVSGLDGVELTACCDPSPAKLKEFTLKHNIADSFLNHREMIEKTSLDGIFNITPDSMHSQIAERVLKAGMPLMTEKPLANGLEECRRLKNLFDRSEIPVVVNFSKRHAPAVAAAKEIISSGCMGRIIRLDASYRQSWVFSGDWGHWESVDSWTWRLDKSYAPLGVLSDLGSHIVDLLRFVTDREIISAAGAVAGVADKGKTTVGKHAIDSSDYVQAILTLEGGIPSTFVASRIDTGEKDSVSMNIYCEKGCLSFNLAENRQTVKVKANRRIRFPKIIWSSEKSVTGPEVDPGQELNITTRKPETNYIKFIRLLKGESCDAPNLIDGLKAQGILEAIHESSVNGGAPTVPEDFN